MAAHGQLLDDLVSSIHGDRSPYTIYQGTKSLNYKFMTYTTDYIRYGDPNIRKYEPLGRQWLHSALSFMNQPDCHMRLGNADEQGAPGKHWSMTFGSMLACLYHAMNIGDMIMANLTWKVLVNEYRICLLFLVHEPHNVIRKPEGGPTVVMPSPRVKKDKGQQPVDGTRDGFVALMSLVRSGSDGSGLKTIEQSKKSLGKFYVLFNQPVTKNNLVLSLLNLVVSHKRFNDLDNTIRHSTEDLMSIKIERRYLDEVDVVSKIPDTPRNRILMKNRDNCNWVRVTRKGNSNVVTWGYDWDKTYG